MITRYPFALPIIARAIHVFPDVGSTIVLFGFKRPFFSASSIIPKAALSLILQM